MKSAKPRSRCRKNARGNYSALSYHRSPKWRPPGGDELEYELSFLRREVEYQKSTVRDLEKRLNFANWAIVDLVTYMEHVIRPGDVPSWGEYRRKLVRLKGGL